jgi:hypothetical protein
MEQGIIENLITQLTKLPGIGRKTAQRLAFFILAMSEEDAQGISTAITEVKEKARFCKECFNITEDEICSICSNSARRRVSTVSTTSCWEPFLRLTDSPPTVSRSMNSSKESEETRYRKSSSLQTPTQRAK